MSSEWPILKIQDVGEVKSGKRLPLEHSLVDVATPYPYIRLVDVSHGAVQKKNLQFLTAETRARIKRYVVNTGDVCLAIVGHTIGMVFYIDPSWNDVNLTENAARITKIHASINSRYLYYYLVSPVGQAEITSRKVGSAQGKLPLYNIKSLEVKVPSRKEQDEIVDTLDAMSSRIDLLRETNATLESIAQSLFKSWFVDFNPVRAKLEGRAPEGMDEATAALFPDGFEESELGLVPKGWRTARLDEFMELAYGKALKSTDRIPGEIPVYGSGGVTGCHNESLVTGPSIIIGRKGTVGSLYWEDQPFFAIDTVFYVRTTIPMTYCFYLLQTLGLTGMNTDAAVPGLNRGNVYRLTVPFPDAAVLSAFDDVVGVIRGQVSRNKQQAQTLATLRDTLLPRLISGALRVTIESN